GDIPPGRLEGDGVIGILLQGRDFLAPGASEESRKALSGCRDDRAILGDVYGAICCPHRDLNLPNDRLLFIGVGRENNSDKHQQNCRKTHQFVLKSTALCELRFVLHYCTSLPHAAVGMNANCTDTPRQVVGQFELAGGSGGWSGSLAGATA